MRRRAAKPHIFRLRGTWFCMTEYFGGAGPTPAKAYEGYLLSFRGRVPSMLETVA